MFKNVAATFVVFAFDTTTNAAKTGDAANITAYVSKDYGGVTVLGDTSATEMDSTNAKGYYSFTAAQAETNADCLIVSAKSSTANIAVIGAPAVIYTRPTTGWLAPTVAARTLDVSAGGEAGVDWANVGSPTAALALTGTTIATTQKVDVETIKTNPVVNGGTVTFPTNATLASTINITAGVITTVTTLTGHTPQTGDAFARLGAPAGASVSADVAAVKLQTAAIETDTQDIQARLPAALTAGGNIKADALAFSGDTVAADNAEAFFDGTGYAGTNNVIPLVTTATNLTNAPTNGDLTAAMKASVNTETDTALTDYGALKPTTAGRTLDVTAANKVAGVVLVDTLTTYTGNTPQTGDGFALANGANGFVAIKGDTAAILVDTGTTLDGKLDTIDTVVDAIKLKTDSLTFTVAGQADVNIESVNGTEVTGAGTAGDPWGP